MTCPCGAAKYALGKCRKCYLKAHYRANTQKYAAYYWKHRERIRTRRAAQREHNRLRHRKYMGLPEPTRPEPPVCELCGGTPTKTRVVLDVDHDHRTGKFRGWLCGRCNGGLGLLGDSIESLKRAVAYLESAQ